MIKLSFWQNDCPIGGSFWQKDSLITHTLFELCLFIHLALYTFFYSPSTIHHGCKRIRPVFKVLVLYIFGSCKKKFVRFANHDSRVWIDDLEHLRKRHLTPFIISAGMNNFSCSTIHFIHNVNAKFKSITKVRSF